MIFVNVVCANVLNNKVKQPKTLSYFDPIDLNSVQQYCVILYGPVVQSWVSGITLD